MLTEEITTSIIVIIIIGIVTLTIFALFEIKRKRKGKIPLLDIDLFKDKNLRTGTMIMLLSYIVMGGGGLFAVALFLQIVLEPNAFNTDLVTLPLTMGLLIFAVAAPKLSEKLNHKTLIAIGSIISIIGCLILSYQFRINTTMIDLIPGMLILGSGLGFIMALSTDIALINIPPESQNNASGIATTGQTLGESMRTAINGVILILGVIGGISNAVDIYTPEHSADEQYHQDIYDYFQKVGTTSEIKTENSTIVHIADTTVQNAMGFVMIVTASLIAIIFVLTLKLQDKKIKKQN